MRGRLRKNIEAIIFLLKINWKRKLARHLTCICWFRKIKGLKKKNSRVGLEPAAPCTLCWSLPASLPSILCSPQRVLLWGWVPAPMDLLKIPHFSTGISLMKGKDRFVWTTPLLLLSCLLKSVSWSTGSCWEEITLITGEPGEGCVKKIPEKTHGVKVIKKACFCYHHVSLCAFRQLRLSCLEAHWL